MTRRSPPDGRDWRDAGGRRPPQRVDGSSPLRPAFVRTFVRSFVRSRARGRRAVRMRQRALASPFRAVRCPPLKGLCSDKEVFSDVE